MHRMSVTEAERDFSKLVDRVHSEGISVELEREDKVIACLSPVPPHSALKVENLNAFLKKLPRLNGDAEAFSEDVRSIRRGFPPETNPWG
jgi:antitoxin (DNA-binding transcriptional repressor) of toxin-antitoxin stability system